MDEVVPHESTRPARRETPRSDSRSEGIDRRHCRGLSFRAPAPVVHERKKKRARSPRPQKSESLLHYFVASLLQRLSARSPDCAPPPCHPAPRPCVPLRGHTPKPG